MARTQDSLERRLCQLFPTSWLEALARETGVLQRRRKVDPVALFWTLILSFGVGSTRTIAALRRAHASATGICLSASAFYDRFTAPLVVFLQRASEQGLCQLERDAPCLRGVLSNFRDLLITDASVLRLHDKLASTYPACRTNHTQAAAKLHLVLSVFGLSEQRVRLTAERKPEGKVLRVGDWVRDRLLLFDLGYFRYALFASIADHGGFFISRLKDGCNPTVVAVHEQGRRQWVGRPLQQVLAGLRRPFLDVEVEVRFKKRAYRGRQTTATRRFRVVGIRNPETRSYHLYVANMAPEVVSAAAIGQLYAARWLIEILFKQLKSYYQLESFPSTNKHVVHALIYSALLTMVASRRIESLLRQRYQQAGQLDQLDQQRAYPSFPWLRLGSVLTSMSAPILQAVLRCAGVKRATLDLTDLILKEAVDPNHRRGTLPLLLETS